MEMNRVEMNCFPVLFVVSGGMKTIKMTYSLVASILRKAWLKLLVDLPAHLAPGS